MKISCLFLTITYKLSTWRGKTVLNNESPKPHLRVAKQAPPVLLGKIIARTSVVSVSAILNCPVKAVCLSAFLKE